MDSFKKRKRKNVFFNLISFFIIFFSFVSLTFAQSGETTSSQNSDLTITPPKLIVDKLPGTALNEGVDIKNNLDKDVLVRVQKIEGKITEVIPSIDRVWTKIGPKESKYLQINGFIKKSSLVGTYNGSIFIEYGEKSYKIPIEVIVIESVGEVALKIGLKPRKKEIKPGESISVVTTISVLSDKSVDVKIELDLVSKKTNEVISKKTVELTNIKSREQIVDIPTSEDFEEGSYRIVGRVYHKEGAKSFKLKSTAEADIYLKRSIFDVFNPLLSLFSLRNIMLSLFLLIALVLSGLSYRYYAEDKEKKKRYLQSILKSIKFETLPKSGPRSGFVGRIAETDIKSFINLDQLKSHTLIAGATGTGKSVCAQIISEEALNKGASVIVFDPTAQWTGFLRKNKDIEIFNKYGQFGMRVSDAKNYKGSIYVVRDPSKNIDIKKNIKPGEITIFCMHQLDSTQIEEFITNTIDEVYKETLEESQELKVLLVYDEIHRILPKFGGSSKGLTWLERGAREFRKWGVGLILISQVLSDFKGEIKANIGTEIQLMTKYEEDMKRIKLKYGEAVHKSIVKAATGEGIIQNAEYNRGFPYFIRFRPPLHSLKRLDDDLLEKYDSFTQKLDILDEKIITIKNAGADAFDLEIELGLAKDNLKEGMFGVVELYLETLEPNIKHVYEKVQKGEITKEDEAIVSDWDIHKEREIQDYEKHVKGSIEEKREKLEKQSQLLRKQKDIELREMEKERLKLMEKEQKKKQELKEEKERLVKKTTVLDILRRYKDLKEILSEDIVSKEWEKIGLQEKKIKDLEEPKLMQMKEERERREKEMEKIIKEMKEEEEKISKELRNIEEMWKRITEDERRIVDTDKRICNDEWELIQKIKEDIKDEIEKRGRIKRELMEEEDKAMEQERKNKDLDIKKRARGERVELKEEKDRLYNEFKKIKGKWLNVLEKENEMKEKDDRIRKMGKELDMKIGERLKKEEEGFNSYKEISDDLLGKLNEKDIEDFKNSDDFKLYEKVMSKDEIDDATKVEFVRIIDSLLEKLPEEEIKKFTKDKEKYGLYKKIAERYVKG